MWVALGSIRNSHTQIPTSSKREYSQSAHLFYLDLVVLCSIFFPLHSSILSFRTHMSGFYSHDFVSMVKLFSETMSTDFVIFERYESNFVENGMERTTNAILIYSQWGQDSISRCNARTLKMTQRRRENFCSGDHTAQGTAQLWGRVHRVRRNRSKTENWT